MAGSGVGRVVVGAGVMIGSVVRRRKIGPQPPPPPRPGTAGAAGADPLPPGLDAQSPTEIPARGWVQILRRAFAESTKDNVGMLAAGVAFFGFLAIFPALIALVSLYGLVAAPAAAAETVRSVTSTLPATVQPLIADQLGAVVSSGNGGLTTGLIVATLAALYSASSGTQNLIAAVNIAYDESEDRNFLELRGLALALTVGAVLFVLVAIALVVVVPFLLDGLGTAGRIGGQIVRWALLVVIVVSGLGAVYRLAPCRDSPRLRWVSLGSLVATLLWIAGSVGFSLYVNNFGSYNKTYGALAGVVVLLLWLYLTSYIVLLGAEINSESELQTARDTTTGEPRPMGRRGATKADDTIAHVGAPVR